MANDFPQGEALEGANALPSITLLATLQTAFDVWRGVEGRRAGRDPSAQEPPAVARAHLQAALAEMSDLHLQLLTASVLAKRSADGDGADGASAAVVRRFDVLMKLRRSERLLHRVHQRLLSLYPAVPEALIEEARRTRHAAGRLMENESLGALPPFLEHLAAFTLHLDDALASLD